MIKKNHRFNKKTKFGKLPVFNNNKKLIKIPELNTRNVSQTEKRWKSIVNLNCKSSEFNNINGIDFFYSVFHHDLKNKDKLKEIINDINNEIDDDREKIITGNYVVKFTRILYGLTKKMIKENTKQYRKFQNEKNTLDKKEFKNWWSTAQQSTFSNTGIGKIILDIRKFWAVFFSGFKNIKNFEKFEQRILAGNDKLSVSYSQYVNRLSKYGVPKFIDPQAISPTHHDNNIKIFTDFSVFSELWRLNKPIFCSYRTLFIECSSGIKEMNNCPFNNWENYNFAKLNIKNTGDLIDGMGDIVMQNSETSIIGHINTGYDWSQEELNRMFERDNPTDRSRLLLNAKRVAEESKHSHGVTGSSAHTHPNNPVYNNSERFLEDMNRANSSVEVAHKRIYANNNINSSDADVMGVLQGKRNKGRILKELKNITQ